MDNGLRVVGMTWHNTNTGRSIAAFDDMVNGLRVVVITWHNTQTQAEV